MTHVSQLIMVYNRFKSELLIAPAVIHHLFKQSGNLDYIIKQLSKFTQKYMIIELISDVINEEKFKKIITNNNFIIQDTLPSFPLSRKWILCLKK